MSRITKKISTTTSIAYGEDIETGTWFDISDTRQLEKFPDGGGILSEWYLHLGWGLNVLEMEYEDFYKNNEKLVTPDERMILKIVNKYFET